MGEWVTGPELVRCPRCGIILGVSLGDALLVGGVRLREPVRMECGGCRQPCAWEPGEGLAAEAAGRLPRKG